MMPSTKRSHDGAPVDHAGAAPPPPPLLASFETFRTELDEHHDRRERVFKASRDVTALSKKIIFTLQRVRTLRQPLPASIANDVSAKCNLIDQLFVSIVPDLIGINAWRYQRQVSPGIQEFIEAISFEHYLRHQQLITHEQCASRLPDGILLTDSDYVLGLFDLVGELMRFGITGMATAGKVPASRASESVDVDADEAVDETPQRDLVTDVRVLRAAFESLDTGKSSGAMASEIQKKMGVMKTCVEKLETAVYGLIIRGRERPTGWVPETNAAASHFPRNDGEAVEGY